MYVYSKTQIFPLFDFFLENLNLTANLLPVHAEIMTIWTTFKNIESLVKSPFCV